MAEREDIEKVLAGLRRQTEKAEAEADSARERLARIAAGLVPLADLGWLYATGVVIVAILLAVEYALVRASNLSRVNLAFFTVNGLISVVLGALTIADVLLV